MDKGNIWLQWAMELQSLAQAGLFYGKDVFDRERYTRIREIAAEMLAHMSDIPVETWVRRWAPRLGHVHIHNNEGGWDLHDHLDRGTIPMAETLKLLAELAPDATWTLETLEAAPSCRWLAEQGWIEE